MDEFMKEERAAKWLVGDNHVIECDRGHPAKAEVLAGKNHSFGPEEREAEPTLVRRILHGCATSRWLLIAPVPILASTDKYLSVIKAGVLACIMIAAWHDGKQNCHLRRLRPCEKGRAKRSPHLNPRTGFACTNREQPAQRRDTNCRNTTWFIFCSWS